MKMETVFTKNIKRTVAAILTLVMLYSGAELPLLASCAFAEEEVLAEVVTDESAAEIAADESAEENPRPIPADGSETALTGEEYEEGNIAVLTYSDEQEMTRSVHYKSGSESDALDGLLTLGGELVLFEDFSMCFPYPTEGTGSDMTLLLNGHSLLLGNPFKVKERNFQVIAGNGGKIWSDSTTAYTVDVLSGGKLSFSPGASADIDKIRINSGAAAALGGYAESSTIRVESGGTLELSGNAKISSFTNYGTVHVNGGSVSNLDVEGGQVYVSGGTVGFPNISSRVYISGGTIEAFPTDVNPRDNVVITGGRFKADPSIYLKEGYKAVYENGYYAVKKNGDATVTHGETVTEYETVEAAFAAVQDGDTIRLLKSCDDVFRDLTIPENRRVVLALGTHTLAVNTLTINGALTIRADIDGAIIGTLKAENNDSVKVNGSLTVESGIYEGWDPGRYAADGRYADILYSDSWLIRSGAKAMIVGGKNYKDLTEALKDVTDNTEVRLLDSDSAASFPDRKFTLDLNGHTLTLSGDISISKEVTLCDSDSTESERSITGGGKFVVEDGGKLSFAPGRPEGIVGISVKSGGTAVIGGTAIVTGAVSVEGGGTLELRGSVYVSSEITNSGKLTVNGGGISVHSISAKSGTTTVKSGSVSLILSGGTVNIEGGRVESLSVVSPSAVLNITGGRFKYDPSGHLKEDYRAEQESDGQESDGYFVIKKADAATVTHSDGGFETYGDINDAFAALQDGDTVTLLRNISSYPALTVPENISVTLALGTNTLTVGSLTVKGTLTVTAESRYDKTGTLSAGTGDPITVETGGRLTFCSGIYSFDPEKYLADGKFAQRMTDRPGTPEKWQVRDGAVVQIVGGRRYGYMTDAITELKDGDTLQLLNNLSDVNELSKLTRSITLDLNKFSLGIRDTITVAEGISLTVTAADNSAKISSGSKTLFSVLSGGSLTVSAVLSGGLPVISNAGTVTLGSGCRILCSTKNDTRPDVASSGTLTLCGDALVNSVSVSGGSFAISGGACINYLLSVSGGQVSIEGGDVGYASYGGGEMSISAGTVDGMIVTATSYLSGNVTAVGGVFGFDPGFVERYPDSTRPVNIVAAGYEAKKTDDGKWEIVRERCLILRDSTGKEIERFYTPEEAFAAMSTAGAYTLELYRDYPKTAERLTIPAGTALSLIINAALTAEGFTVNGSLNLSGTGTLTAVSSTGFIGGSGKVTVSSGQYVNWNPTDCLAPGKVAKSASESTWVILDGKVKRGDVLYAELADAVAAAKRGDTITLLSDIELADTLTICGKDNLTIDLNGKKLVYLGFYVSIKIQNSVLTLRNGNLRTKNDADSVSRALQCENNSTLTLDGLDVFVLFHTSVAAENSRVNILGGEYHPNNTGMTFTNCTVSITGGRFHEWNPTAYVNTELCRVDERTEGAVLHETVYTVVACCAKNLTSGKMYERFDLAMAEVQAGETVQLLADASFDAPIAVSAADVTVDLNNKTLTYSGTGTALTLSGGTIAGGTFTAPALTLDGGDSLKLAIDTTAPLTLTGSSTGITGGSYGSITLGAGAALRVTGGSFTGWNPTLYAVPSARIDTKTVDGKMIYTVVDCEAAINNTKYETLALAFEKIQNGGTITLLKDLSYDPALVLDSTGRTALFAFTLDLGGFTLGGAGLSLVKTALTVTGEGSLENIRADGKSPLTVSADTENIDAQELTITGGEIGNISCSKLTVTGGTFKNNLVFTRCADFDISGGRFEGTVYFDGYTDVSGSISGGTFRKMFYVNQAENITVSGGDFGGDLRFIPKNSFCKIAITGGTFHYAEDYDWKNSGNNYDSFIPENYFPVYYYATEESAGYWKIEQLSDRVCRIGSTDYPTLAVALQEAVSGNTITVMKDHSFDRTLIVKKAVTLDFGGCTVSYTGSGTAISVETTGATIKNGTLTLSGDATGIALAENSAAMVTMNISGGAVAIENKSASLSVTGGSYTGSQYGLYSEKGTNTIETTVSGISMNDQEIVSIEKFATDKGSRSKAYGQIGESYDESGTKWRLDGSEMSEEAIRSLQNAYDYYQQKMFDRRQSSRAYGIEFASGGTSAVYLSGGTATLKGVRAIGRGKARALSYFAGPEAVLPDALPLSGEGGGTTPNVDCNGCCFEAEEASISLDSTVDGLEMDMDASSILSGDDSILIEGENIDLNISNSDISMGNNHSAFNQSGTNVNTNVNNCYIRGQGSNSRLFQGGTGANSSFTMNNGYTHNVGNIGSGAAGVSFTLSGGVFAGIAGTLGIAKGSITGFVLGAGAILGGGLVIGALGLFLNGKHHKEQKIPTDDPDDPQPSPTPEKDYAYYLTNPGSFPQGFETLAAAAAAAQPGALIILNKSPYSDTGAASAVEDLSFDLRGGSLHLSSPINVTGGSFHFIGSGTLNGSFSVTGGKLNITGSQSITSANAAAISVTGGELSITGTPTVTATKGSAVAVTGGRGKITGGSYTGGAAVGAFGDLTITGGSFDHTDQVKGSMLRITGGSFGTLNNSGLPEAVHLLLFFNPLDKSDYVCGTTLISGGTFNGSVYALVTSSALVTSLTNEGINGSLLWGLVHPSGEVPVNGSTETVVFGTGSKFKGIVAHPNGNIEFNGTDFAKGNYLLLGNLSGSMTGWHPFFFLPTNIGNLPTEGYEGLDNDYVKWKSIPPGGIHQVSGIGTVSVSTSFILSLEKAFLTPPPYPRIAGMISPIPAQFVSWLKNVKTLMSGTHVYHALGLSDGQLGFVTVNENYIISSKLKIDHGEEEEADFFTDLYSLAEEKLLKFEKIGETLSGQDILDVEAEFAGFIANPTLYKIAESGDRSTYADYYGIQKGEYTNAIPATHSAFGVVTASVGYGASDGDTLTIAAKDRLSDGSRFDHWENADGKTIYGSETRFDGTNGIYYATFELISCDQPTTVVAVYRAEEAEVSYPNGTDKSFFRLADAVDSVKASGGTIRLLRDVTLPLAGLTINAAKPVTLDLNGKKLTSGKDTGFLTVKSSLTLTGGGELNTVVKEDETPPAQLVFVDGGSLTVGEDANCVFRGVTGEITAANSSSVALMSGLYSHEVPESYLPKDFFCVAEENGWRVEEGKLITLSSDCGGESAAFVTGGGIYPRGERIKISAYSVAAYKFVGWYEGETKLSASRSFEYTVETDARLIAKYMTVDDLQYTLTVECDGESYYYTIDGKQCMYKTEKILPVGEHTLCYTGSDSFLFWVNSTNKVVSRNREYSFRLVGPTKLRAVTAPTGLSGSIFAAFVSVTGQLLSAKLHSDVNAIEYPPAPYKMGGEFVGWNKTTEQIKAAMTDGSGYIEIRPVYTQSADTYTVSVFANSENGDELASVTQKLGEVCTVTVPQEYNGQKFSYLRKAKETETAEEEILGYSESYSLRADRDVTLVAVYGKEIEAEAANVGITSVSRTYDSEKQKYILSVTLGYTVREGHTVDEVGLLLSGNPNAEFVVGGTGVTRIPSALHSQSGSFTVNLSASDPNKTLYLCGYVLYDTTEEKYSLPTEERFSDHTQPGNENTSEDSV